MDHLALLHRSGVFLRREALEHGYDDADLRTCLRNGTLARIRHGAYTSARMWEAADDYGRHRLHAHAVLLSHHSTLVLSHTSAAVFHGLRMVDTDLAKVHVTCPGGQIARTTDDVVYHRGALTDQDLRMVDGVTVVEPARAAVESAALMSVPHGLVVVDSALDVAGVAPDDVWRAYRIRAGWPDSRRLQVVVRLMRPGANSVGESLARHLMWRSHLPEPELQFEVRDRHGRLIGRTDFAWPEYGVLGEFDGLVKYGRLLRPGESAQDAVVREKVREDRLREATGWLMTRLTWADLQRPDQTAHRVQEQLRRGQLLLRGSA